MLKEMNFSKKDLSLKELFGDFFKLYVTVSAPA